MQSRRVRHSPEVLSQPLGDETVLLDLRSGLYYSLNAVATRMWDLMAERGETSSIVAVMVDEHDVDEARVEADLERLLARLERAGLVTLS